MSDISNFFTSQITTGTQSAQNGALSGGNGVFVPGLGMTFMDLILGQIAAGEEAKNQQNQKAAITALQTKQNSETDTADALTAELLINAADIAYDRASIAQQTTTITADAIAHNTNAQNAKDIAIDLAAAKTARIEKRLETLDKIIAHFTGGVPQEVQDHPAIQAFVERLQERVQTLQTTLDDLQGGQDVPSPALIALGLNPAQLSKINARIEEVEEKLGRDLTVEDLVAGVANIIPLPSEETPVIFSAPGQIKAAAPAGQPANQNIPANGSLEAKLNSLVVGGNGGSNGKPSLPQPFNTEGARGAEADPKFTGKTPDIGAPQPKADVAANIQASATKTPPVTTTNWQDNALTLPSGWYQAFFDGAEWGSLDSLQSGLPLSQISQAAHMTTQVQQAGQPHPATQIVAATLHKAAQTGETRNMTLRLDPPELGRVDVRLEFGHDKSIKAHLVVEKPETYMMLQRDTATLERALQNAGLEPQNNSLSFELSEDGSAFEQNNHGDGNSDGHAYGDDSMTLEEETIQSTMTWAVDPETGYMRYSILA